jgi:eukaryotic-like serine/threonine-protein kinase
VAAWETVNKKLCPACKHEYPATEVVCPVDNVILMVVGPDPLLGTTLAEKYLIMSEIGRGGMSIVYKGKYMSGDRVVAIKMLHAQLADDLTSTKRFQLEAQAVSSLSHRNVVGVHEYGIAPSGQPYIVMDFLVGESLADVIRRDNHIPERRAIGIISQACDALDHAHKKGVVHRDLKAGNIMLVSEEGNIDVVKVVDFGIAKLMPSSGQPTQNLTQTGEVFGSPIYMSPEQCVGQPLDARSDIYSMGVVLYEALTGYPPLMGNTIIETMQKHVKSKPRAINKDLNVSKEMEAVVLKALEKDPDGRFDSMRSFGEALEHVGERLLNIGARKKTEQESEMEFASGGWAIRPSPGGRLSASNANMARARMTGAQRLTSTSRYKPESADSTSQTVSAPDQSDNGQIAPEETKSLPVPILLLVSIAFLFLMVIVFFLTRHH